MSIWETTACSIPSKSSGFMMASFLAQIMGDQACWFRPVSPKFFMSKLCATGLWQHLRSSRAVSNISGKHFKQLMAGKMPRPWFQLPKIERGRELKDHTVLPAWLTWLAQSWAEAACLTKKFSTCTPNPLILAANQWASKSGRETLWLQHLMKDVSQRRHPLAHWMVTWLQTDKGIHTYLHLCLVDLLHCLSHATVDHATMLGPSPPKRALHQAHALSMSTSGWPKSAGKGKHVHKHPARAESWAWEEPARVTRKVTKQKCQTALLASRGVGAKLPCSWDTAILTCGSCRPVLTSEG